MRFPFPKWLPKVPVTVYQTELSEDGEPVKEVIYDGLAFYDEKSKQVLDAERRLVLLTGLVIIEGDIRSGKVIEGLVKVNGVDKTIHKTIRPRNPDGTVYSTELMLM